MTRHVLRALALPVLFLLALAPSAQADFGIDYFGAALGAGDGSFSRQAGAHADLNIRLEFPRTAEEKADGSLRDVTVDLPPGLVGNPTSAATCTFDQLIPNGQGFPDCPIASQVGFAAVTTDPAISRFGAPDIPASIYNMRRPKDAPALLAFNYGGAAVKFEPRVRPSDYGISSDSRAISQALPPFYVDVTLWAVPADPIHDPLRTDPPYSLGTASPDARKPFLSSPTSCSGSPLTFNVFADTWQDPAAVLTKSLTSDRDGTPFQMTGCELVPFNPTSSVEPASRQAGAPTGFDVDLTVPQSNSPDVLASAHVRKTVVTFPKGVSVSPSSAAGQGACSEAQIGIGSNAAPTCPDSSRIGTVAIKTPLLDEELQGSLYLAEPHANPFGSLLATYLAIKGPGFYLKLPGEVQADPETGRLTATFDNQPQLPYETVSVSLRGGPGAPLLAPPSCGTYNTQVEMTSWASPVPVTLTSPMTIDQSCATGGFDPKLHAGTTDPIAGAFSPFLLQLTRQDGEQNIARIEATLPPGLLAKLAGVPLCPDPAAATGACPTASQVGITTVAAGAGPTPLFVPEAGKDPTAIYLAGPYKGAPYSLLVKVPAQAGPFDLGTVTVRNALRVDPVSAQVTAVSDPLPQILQGIPIAYRDVRVEINRPGFTLNPTSCEPRKITSTIASAGGAGAHPSARFQAADCGELAFRPRLALSLEGATRRSGHPALRAVLRARKGDANIARASVALPHSEFLAQSHIRTVCTRVQFAAGAGNGAGCPKGSIYGKATANTPLLDQPLSGPVYLRSSSNPLPDLVAALHGQIDVDLVGRIDSKNGGIRTTFDAVPDAPVSKFVLTMQGGKKGLLENSRNLCGSTNRAEVRFTAQNGKAADSGALLRDGCKKKGSAR